jgi:hypothetical protein
LSKNLNTQSQSQVQVKGVDYVRDRD